MDPNQIISFIVRSWMKRQGLCVKAAARRLRMSEISLKYRLDGAYKWRVDELLRLYDEGIHIPSELFQAIKAEEVSE